MKSIVVYFSLTGNTRKIAKAIHQGVSQLSEQGDIATIKEIDTQHLSDYDLIGLGSPVWRGVPPNVRLLIEAMPPLKGKHAFAFSTHGCLGEFFFEVIELLEKKGLIVIGIRDWYGSVYLPGLPKPYLTDGHPDDIDLKEAEDFGKEIAGLSLRISAEGPQLIPQLPPIPTMPPPNRTIRPLPKLNMAKCLYPGCHLCMDNCPMDGINLAVSPRVFAKPCNSCHFCEMICPEGAIEVDYESLAKPSLQRMKEVYLEHLDRAEAEGRFRRLVPLEAVDFNTPFYRVYHKHPRYVIPEE
jgi:flavodoxin/ferredoxin